MKFTFLVLNLAKIQISIPKSAYGGRAGGAGAFGIPKLYVKFWWPLFLGQFHTKGLK